MFIPAAAAQVNLLIGGSPCPQGAQMTFGVAGTILEDPTEIGHAVITAVEESNFFGNAVTDLIMTGVLVKHGPNDTGPSAEVGANIRGETSGMSVPPNVSVLVRKSTVQGGRKGQGRFFWPGLPEQGVGNEGLLTQQYLGDLQVAMDSFLDELASAGLNMLLLHSEEESSDLP